MNRNRNRNYLINKECNSVSCSYVSYLISHSVHMGNSVTVIHITLVVIRSLEKDAFFGGGGIVQESVRCWVDYCNAVVTGPLIFR